MKSGYNIRWTNHAKDELNQTIAYVEANFPEKILRKLATELEKTLYLIAQNPKLFPISETIKVRRVVVLKFNTLCYQEQGKSVVILSFFSNRQDPKRSILS